VVAAASLQRRMIVNTEEQKPKPKPPPPRPPNRSRRKPARRPPPRHRSPLLRPQRASRARRPPQRRKRPKQPRARNHAKPATSSREGSKTATVLASLKRSGCAAHPYQSKGPNPASVDGTPPPTFMGWEFVLPYNLMFQTPSILRQRYCCCRLPLPNSGSTVSSFCNRLPI